MNTSSVPKKKSFGSLSKGSLYQKSWGFSGCGRGLITLVFLGMSSIALIEPWRDMAPAFAGQVTRQSDSQAAGEAQTLPSNEKKPTSQSKEQAGKQPLPSGSSAPGVGKPEQAHPEPAPKLPASGGPTLASGAPSRAPQNPPATSTGQAPQKEAAQPPPPSGPAPAPPTPALGGAVSFRLENADLMQFINLVASQLKMSYVVDPAVKGTVTITTAGELRREDLFPILQSVLRINGATAIQSGNFYRIVPLNQAAKIPVEVSNNATGKTIPEDDRMMMQIIPLRFVFAADMAKMLTPFLSDGGTVAVHEAGNVLIVLDTSLNIRRLMDIVQQFDSSAFAQQRVRLVSVQHNVASGLVPELESIFAAYALSEKTTPIRFLPLDRINSLLVVTPDPAAFSEVEQWVRKLDQPSPPSGVQTFIYKVQNSEANYLQGLLTHVEQRGGEGAGTTAGAGEAGGRAGGRGGAASSTREIGAAAGSEPESGQRPYEAVRITTDPLNNSLIIQCTPQQYAEIVKTLQQVDVIPRQVMIEARVYEVDLSGDLSFGLSYYLQQRSNTVKQPLGSFSPTSAVQASAGALIGNTRELLGYLNASENRSRIRVLSAPTVLATDNSDAKIQVGTTVPTLTSQAVIPGVQAGGSSVFTNTIQNIDTGIILTVTPRITSTGLVSLRINQEISSAEPPAAGAIQSPSFLKRSIATVAVVGDGQTIALGGLISETITYSRNSIPLLGNIPGLGALFSSTSYTTAKTELIIFLTPRIMKSIEEASDATRELRDTLKEVRRAYKKDKVVNP